MVLGAIAILTVLLTEFQDETSAELAAAVNDRDALKAEYMARSAVNLSRLLIAAEPTIRQGLSLFFLGKTPPQIPIWEFSDKILGAFNDSDGTAGFAQLTGTDLSTAKNLGMSGGKFEVSLVDEDSKIDVNIAARGDPISEFRLATQLTALTMGDQYRTMFEQQDRDGQFTDRATITGAIIDWADPDENLFMPPDPKAAAPSTGAAEDSFYQMLKRPFRRKNAAYDSLEELHLVRGVSDDFWATFVDPDPEKPNKRVLTVWGQGAVNVNTANAQTVLAVVCSGVDNTKPNLCNDPMQMSQFLMAVTLIRSFTAGAPLFFSPKDFIATLQGKGMFGPLLSAVGIQPLTFLSVNETLKMITTESKVFSVYADGIVPGYQRKTKVRIHAVVDFRDAPPPGMPPMPAGMGGMPGAGTGAMPGTPGGAMGMGTVPGGPITSGMVGPGGATGIPGALMPNPGGTIIYWRME